MQSLDYQSIFITPLEKTGVSYFVSGSVAAIFYGEPRLTHDVDVVIHFRTGQIDRFIEAFPENDFYCPPEEVIRIESARVPYGHFNLIHHGSGLKADIYTDCNDELHKWAFDHINRVEVSKGHEVSLAPPEYVILRKLEFYREGKSEKHLQDIQKMLPQVSGEMDQFFLESEIEKRGLGAIWAQMK